jgi:hypothetical protein
MDQIIALIREFAPMIIECFQEDEAKAMKRLRNLGPLEVIRLRRGLRRQGVVFSDELNDRMQEIRDALQSASDADLREILAIAKESV